MYREQKNFDGAEKLLRELASESSDDANVASALVEVVSLAAADAAAAGDGNRVARSRKKRQTSFVKHRRLRIRRT